VIENKDLNEIAEDGEIAEEATGRETEGAAPPAVPMEPSESAVTRLAEQLAEVQERHLRLAAEFDNYRKRVARERLEINERAQAALVIRLLEVLDDMDRLVAADPSGTVDSVHQAMILVDRKMRKELEAAGLERIEAEGQTFDPTVHEAVAVTPASSPEQHDYISATFQVGYRFKGTLVRAARVQVYSAESDD
jgi:molecular chaperone GrpE